MRATILPPWLAVILIALSVHAQDADDQWNTEDLSAAALSQLKKLAVAEDSKNLQSIIVDDFESSPLQPAKRVRLLHDANWIVERSTDHSPAKTTTKLIDELRSLPRGKSHFKIFRIESNGQLFTTLVKVQFDGPMDGGFAQINATWQCQWSSEGDSPPRLKSIRITNFTKVQRMGKPPFVDCTESALGANASYHQQLRHGVDHWMSRIEYKHGIDIGGWQGLAIGDVNGDHLDDLYACQPGGLPNLLYLQKPDGTLSDHSKDAGTDFLDSTHGALMIDVDNDGDQDLAIGVNHGVIIMANNGAGTFKQTGAYPLPAAIPYSLTAADYDNDGNLDLYVCCYNRRAGVNQHLVFARPVPYHDANNGGRNVLLQNVGDGQFKHVTASVGLDQNNRRFSYAAAWEDYDNDGDQDLYVANDFGRNNLYRNNSGRFSDVASECGVEDIAPGMSVTWGDYDNDGLMDIYVSNMFSSAGNRIAFADRFHKDADVKTRATFQRHARGNSLFKNLGNGKFRDVSIVAGADMGRWAWGSTFCDLNNDGREDLLVTNGFITQEDTGDL